MPAPRCPTCRREVLPPGTNRAFPFCSDRCRLIDLGRWLGEEYRVPAASEEEAPAPSADASGSSSSSSSSSPSPSSSDD